MQRSTKLTLTAAVFSLGMIATASAADMRPAYKAPPVAAPIVNSWAGFYIGGHAGGGWVNDGDGAFIGGGQIGYNWQFAPNWVLGIEADISGTDFGGSSTLVVPGGSLTVTSDLNWLASVRGRLGYTWDNVMVYFTGGGAWADLEGTATLTIAGVGTSTATASADASGWVLGGGLEWMFAPNWTLGVEYLHYTFDDVSGTVAGPGGTASFAFSGGNDSVDVVRARLNYKFGPWLGTGLR